MIERKLSIALQKAFQQLFNFVIDADIFTWSATKEGFAGDFTFVVFPYVKPLAMAPDRLGEALGDFLLSKLPEVSAFNVVKGFLNISLSHSYWLQFIQGFDPINQGNVANPAQQRPVVIEFSSPNTNKPLHLGHIRNNLLGDSISRIIAELGIPVVKVNLVNDRGIHICKSMLAWQKFGHGETPQSSGLKGDHLVGKYYVEFDKHYKQQIAALVSGGVTAEEAALKAPILLEARDLLRRWEQGDPEVLALWNTMNSWVYEGFDLTYHTLGISFDKTYFESQTYLAGKEMVAEGVQKGIFEKMEDGSVWVDLTAEGLDRKLLLRSDGTSVYITQDLGTAMQRHDELDPSKMIYVVGNEQEYHFSVLQQLIHRLGLEWYKDVYHLSYGMVELPSGKMKSREGTVVDADDLMAEMFATAQKMAAELGKAEDLTAEEAALLYRMIGLGALKYFILKVDPRKNMLFDPMGSIDFNGNTGPFIQYTYARICSVLRKAASMGLQGQTETGWEVNDAEMAVMRCLHTYKSVLIQSAALYSPALIANYCYELASLYNRFYHDFNILKEENQAIRSFRLMLSAKVSLTLQRAMGLLGIEVPERM